MTSLAIVHTGVRSTVRLQELDLTPEVLQEAVKFGVQHIAECTNHDPPSTLGMIGWGKMTRAIRDALVPAGWKVDNARNYATTIHPGGRLAIAVSAGDSGTGDQERTPTTRTDKGPATRDAVLMNIRQGSFADIAPDFNGPDFVAVKQTWLLLHYVDDEAGETRMELSLPDGMDADGYVVTWRERIVLAPQAFGVPSFLAKSRSAGTPGSAPIDVPVARRSQ